MIVAEFIKVITQFHYLRMVYQVLIDTTYFHTPSSQFVIYKQQQPELFQKFTLPMTKNQQYNPT